MWHERLAHKLKNVYSPRTIRLCTALCAASVLLALVTVFMGEYLILRYFLLWNIFLAALPLVFALLAVYTARRRKAPLLSFVLWGLWLVFFPNAPYMITDLIHVREYSYNPGYNLSPSGASWFGLAHIVSCVAIGCVFGFLSLYLLHGLVRRRHGRAAGWLFCTGTSLLCGIGLYIGRFMRFNSWDLAHRPLEVLSQMAQRINLSTLKFFGLFAAITLGGYLLFYLCFDASEEQTYAQPKAIQKENPES